MDDLKSNKQKANQIVKLLKKHYGNEAICHLKADKDYEFLFSVILSAQCKDERVNKITPILFKKYKNLAAFSNANIKDIENIIHPLGFYKMKAKSLLDCSKDLLSKYGGRVPRNFDELVTLKGVGRKTANVVLGQMFNVSAIAVDTHVNRISNRLFTLNETNPDRVEGLLKDILKKEYYVLWNTHIISFGREICFARSPKCDICFLNKYCNYYSKMLS